MTKNRFVLALLLIIHFNGFISAQSDIKLWFRQPAQYFEETLVLGNGKMGASIFGDTHSDKIYLNDATLWSGEPVKPEISHEAYKNIPAIREALKKNEYALAEKLNKKMQGPFSESYAPLGTLKINFTASAIAENYYRELDLNDAVSKVSYEIEGVKYTREYFISYPDQIMIIKLTSSKKGALSFNLNFESLLKYKISMDKNTFTVHGYAPYHAEPSYRRNNPVPVAFDEKRGTRFTTQFRLKNSDGSILKTDSTIGLKNGTEAIIFVSMATSFNGFDKNPATEGLNDAAMATSNLNKAFQKSFQKLKDAHIKDYQHYFNRVSLDLGKTNAPNLPTNERLKRYASGEEDKNLEILYFQFGRYLLISSSRTSGVPANLQGIWNPYLRPPWSSNYTTNINLQENYWLAENANLSEMHLPLMDFIDHISKTGSVTARTFYGVGGWAACQNSDIWAMSNPVGESGQGDPSWACWNMGGTWLSTHLWEHYQFTGDEAFLGTKGYPIMKGAAQFCLEWLIRDEKGNLITSPSTSPENKFITPDGLKSSTMYGGTADLAMIRECFEQTIQASKVLNTDLEFRTKLENALSALHPYQVGKKGNLQEWYYDWDDVDPQHRHQSHLFGLFPGNHISPAQTPGLAAACRRTLEIKGDETTGWSKGWRINLWARLLDGNHAYKMYRELLKYVEPDGVKTTAKRGGGTYPNLFDAHPPFQIDGNFSGAAAVIEMLLQSDGNEVRLLPALPDTWNEGSVKGIRARGGFAIGMTWRNHQLTEATVSPLKSGSCKLITTVPLEIETKAIHSVKGTFGFFEITFETKAGETVKLTAPKTSSNYVFVYFNNNGKDGMHMAGSKDGLNWKPFRNDSSFLAPKVGKDSIMRDPCIISGLDGKFHMVWTDSWTDKGIGYANSTDLIHWSKQVFLPVMEKEDGARNCWAPEITCDPVSKTYMIYWATTIQGKFKETLNTLEKGYNHRIYYVTTKDFKTFSDTKLLYDPGFNVIDATIVNDNGRYIMFIKDETRVPVQKNLKIAFSDHLTGPYSKAGTPITGNYWAEGPTTVKLNNAWIVYFDKYTQHKYGAISSTNLTDWTDISDKISLPKGIRHGSIFSVDDEVYKLLNETR